MKNFFIGLYIGVLLSIIGNLALKQYYKSQHKYEVGDCVSNGLFVQRITAIKFSDILWESSYELIGTINGKLVYPDSTASWIVDRYVQVNKANCL
jgi:hypothetical protein